MRYKLTPYWVLLAIFLLSILGALLLQENGLLQGLVAAPAALSLFGALFQLLRDQATYEKELDLQSREIQFAIGTASHMANKAFDKHAEFCEKYMEEIHSTVRTLFREAETEEALDHAVNLWSLRQEYAVWLTDEINENLDRFESAIRKLGANAHFVHATTGQKDHAEKRMLKIDENFDLFTEILGLDPEREMNEDFTVEAVKRKVRDVLGVEELLLLRTRLLREATHAVRATHT